MVYSLYQIYLAFLELQKETQVKYLTHNKCAQVRLTCRSRWHCSPGNLYINSADRLSVIVVQVITIKHVLADVLIFLTE